MCRHSREACRARAVPLASSHVVSLLSGIRYYSFWYFPLLPRGLALGIGLLTTVTLVWGSEGLFQLFGACCHDSQLQSLARPKDWGMCPPAWS